MNPNFDFIMSVLLLVVIVWVSFMTFSFLYVLISRIESWTDRSNPKRLYEMWWPKFLDSKIWQDGRHDSPFTEDFTGETVITGVILGISVGLVPIFIRFPIVLLSFCVPLSLIGLVFLIRFIRDVRKDIKAITNEKEK